MGTVWEARHLSLETQIAIKFLNSDLSRRHDVLARFAREATSAARINSPYVVGILDSGFTDDGHGFIAMELLRGEDLGRRLARLGTLTLNETAALVTQVARGLAKAHAVGVVHRDLKPENIFVVEEDEALTVKILDFGIAKSIGPEAATHKTDTGQLLGTPLYMSPEQALGRPLDSRSDLYSLAVVAYRCLTGRPPFTHNAVGELIVAVSTHAPPPPSDFNPELSPEIDSWFASALAKDPNARICQKASEVGESFGQACGGASSRVHPSSDPPRALRSSSPPPRRNDTEQTPVPSAEEVATTLHAEQAPLAHRRMSRQRFARLRTPALVSVCALAAGLVGSRMRTSSPAPTARSSTTTAKAAALERTLAPALPATAERAPEPRPSGTDQLEAHSTPRAPAQRSGGGSPLSALRTRSLARSIKEDPELPAKQLVSPVPGAAIPDPEPTPIEAAAPPKSGPLLDRGNPWLGPEADK
jgi:serine/threonine-protein kinase